MIDKRLSEGARYEEWQISRAVGGVEKSFKQRYPRAVLYMYAANMCLMYMYITVPYDVMRDSRHCTGHNQRAIDFLILR